MLKHQIQQLAIDASDALFQVFRSKYWIRPKYWIQSKYWIGSKYWI